MRDVLQRLGMIEVGVVIGVAAAAAVVVVGSGGGIARLWDVVHGCVGGSHTNTTHAFIVHDHSSPFGDHAVVVPAWRVRVDLALLGIEVPGHIPRQWERVWWE